MPLEPMMPALHTGLAALAVAIALFGAWSAAQPARSIALYPALMRRFNWRVEPMDAPRELRTTRWLGAVLVCLGIVNLVVLRW